MKNKSIFLSIFAAGLLLSCGNPSTSPKEKEDIDDDPTGGDVIDDKSATLTKVFKNVDFSGSFDQEASRNTFVSWFNQNSQEDEIQLESVSVEGYVQMNEVIKDTLSTFIIGSKKKEGSFTFNFNLPVSKIEFKVSPYFNSWSYHDAEKDEDVVGFNVDPGCVFLIEDDRHELVTPEEGEPEEVSFSKEFSLEDNKKTITIANEGIQKRVFVNEMKVTYEKA